MRRLLAAQGEAPIPAPLLTPPSPAKGLAMTLLELVEGAADAGPAARETKASILRSALIRMGTAPAEADRVVAALGDRVAREPLADLMGAAVRLMR